jgi:NADH dehydrogenase/NADH:ubiquinone oxidoreductase subunit G
VDNGAVLVTVGDSATGLDEQARMKLPLSQVGSAEGVVQAAQRPVVLYGAGLSQETYDALKAWPSKVRFLPLIKGTNAAGAARLGLSAKPVHGDVLYVLAGDDLPDGSELPQAAFTIVQAAYESAWTAAADVILPAQVWTEKSGHIVNVEGRDLPVAPFVKAPKGVPADDVALGILTIQMGKGPKVAKRAAVAAN